MRARAVAIAAVLLAGCGSGRAGVESARVLERTGTTPGTGAPLPDLPGIEDPTAPVAATSSGEPGPPAVTVPTGRAGDRSPRSTADVTVRPSPVRDRRAPGDEPPASSSTPTGPASPTTTTAPRAPGTTRPPATAPPVTSPPATSPPATSPPATSPPPSSPPATSPPPTAPPPTAPPPPRDANLVPSPGLESGTSGWVDHGRMFPGQSGQVWGRQSGWAHSGSWSMRQRSTAGDGEVAPGIYGVAGSYVAPRVRCTAGERLQLTAWVNNLVELPAGSPGVWLELFWFDDVGRVVRQDNSASIHQRAPVGVRQLSMTGTCPSGAVEVHALSVGATNTPGTTVDFYTDDVSLRRV